MALVSKGNGAGFFLSCTLMDTQGDLSTLRYELQSADYATALTDTAAIVGKLSGVSGSQVVGTSLSFMQEEDAVAFPAGADNGVRARMTFQLAGGNKKATLDIPAPKNTIFEQPSGPSNNIVDLNNADVVAYVGIFQSGGQAFISDGELSDFALRGKRTTR